MKHYLFNKINVIFNQKRRRFTKVKRVDFVKKSSTRS